MEKKIKIYSTPTCYYCLKAKEFFAKHGIKYEEVNVVTDMKAREEAVRKSHQTGVPVIEIGHEVFAGFDRVVLEEALGLRSKK